MNQKANNLESLYAALGTQVLPTCSNNDPGLTLTYYTARSNLVPYAFVWETVKTMEFAETNVVYDVKVDRCSHLNEYLKLYEYQRSRSLIDLGQNLSDLIFLNFFSSISPKPIEVRFHVKPPSDSEQKLFKWSRSHDKDGRHAHIW